jgi:hypothetical protein
LISLGILFLHPLVVENVWLWLAPPLLLAIAVVWRTLKCENLRRLPLQVLRLFLMEVVGLTALGASLYIIFRLAP